MKQRKRHPLDVPTPVAVALADFCRRSGAVTDPRSVRDALSLIDAASDARITALAAEPPSVKSLGPFAVIDVLDGMSPADAAMRQREGRYDTVLFMDAPDRPTPPMPEGIQAERLAARPTPPPPSAKRTRKQRAADEKQAVADRIAPTRRQPGDPLPAPRIAASAKPPPESNWPKRDLPKGRGRFTRVDAVKGRAAKLFEPHMREEVESLAKQSGHRFALLKALALRYVGKNGVDLAISDVESVLAHHKLRPIIEESERLLVISAVTEAKGSFYKAAADLGLKPDDLEHIALNSGSAAEIDKIREHHAREALAHGNVRLKLDLLETPKYLTDLGVERRFRDALTVELKELADASLEGVDSVAKLIQAIALAQGLSVEKLRKAMDHTGLSAQYVSRLAS